MKYYEDLPDDLKNFILSKIRYSINKELDSDIVNFKTFKEKVITEYLKKGYDYDINGEFYIYYQIENDLIRFYNDDFATMSCISRQNIEKLNRILSIKNKMKKNKETVVHRLIETNNIDVNSRINILIGALTCEERDMFLQMFVDV
jgi:hypothetical protein